MAASEIYAAVVSSTCGSYGMVGVEVRLGGVCCTIHGGVVILFVMGSTGWSKLAITVRFIAGAVVVTA